METFTTAERHRSLSDSVPGLLPSSLSLSVWWWAAFSKKHELNLLSCRALVTVTRLVKSALPQRRYDGVMLRGGACSVEISSPGGGGARTPFISLLETSQRGTNHPRGGPFLRFRVEAAVPITTRFTGLASWYMRALSYWTIYECQLSI